MKKLFAILLVITLSGPANADTFDVYGLWLTQAENAHIKVMDCGDGTPCGVLVWVDPATTESEHDIRNAVTKLRDRPLIGVPIVWGFERGQKGWRSGHIYNPEYGKIYASSMRLQKNGKVKVKGCLGPLCITNIWTPVETRAREQ